MKVAPTVEDFNSTAVAMLEAMVGATTEECEDELKLSLYNLKASIQVDRTTPSNQYMELMSRHSQVPCKIMMEDESFPDDVSEEMLHVDMKKHWQVLSVREENRAALWKFLFLLNYYSMMLSMPSEMVSMIKL